MKPLIFVSCGQVTPEEINLGREIVNLIHRDGRYEPYFAENQSSVEAVTTNILEKLDAAAGFVAIMHPRGDVETPSGDSGSKRLTRGSVWIEQEIAIQAMLVQVQRRKVAVQLYTRQGITREGLRLYVMTNPPARRTHAGAGGCRALRVGGGGDAHQCGGVSGGVRMRFVVPALLLTLATQALAKDAPRLDRITVEGSWGGLYFGELPPPSKLVIERQGDGYRSGQQTFDPALIRQLAAALTAPRMSEAKAIALHDESRIAGVAPRPATPR